MEIVLSPLLPDMGWAPGLAPANQGRAARLSAWMGGSACHYLPFLLVVLSLDEPLEVCYLSSIDFHRRGVHHRHEERCTSYPHGKHYGHDSHT